MARSLSVPRRLRNLGRAPAPPRGPDPLAAIRTELDLLRLAVGAEAARSARAAVSMRDAEFRCFSQNGEDGVIQWLLARVPIADPSFVEFGVGSYRESNTRFLLQHDNWRGLILDSGTAHLRTVATGELAWKFAIEARRAFITIDNINELLADVPADLGLLSIDIDGNDYWILAAIDVRPRILIVEYNSVLGHERPVAVTYAPAFDRHHAHSTGIYSGCSIAALATWGRANGYRLVGSNSAGNNAFLVRADCAGSLPDLAPADAWVPARFGRPRDAAGNASHVADPAARRALIADLPLVDVASGEALTVGDLRG